MIGVTGTTGMLGLHVARTFARSGQAIYPLRGTELLDGTTAVVHCAAMTDRQACEERYDDAKRANSDWPADLARRTHEMGVRLIHISTVSVYDGSKNIEHSEGEELIADGAYAQTKLIGEQLVMSAHPDATVVRSMIYGHTVPGRRLKLAGKILAALTGDKVMVLWRNQFFCPLYTGDLADAIVKLIGLKAPGPINLGSPDVTDQLNFGRTLAAAYGYDDSCLVGGARRPGENLAVDVSRATELLGALPSVRDGLRRFRTGA